MSSTVHVEGISSQTTEKEVRDFFSFCGKISTISVTPTSNEANATKSATVSFEKESAAKTALLLDNTQLGPTQVHVTSAASLGELTEGQKGEEAEDEQNVNQEDKPRTRIVAEYLAHGYVLSDKVIESAIQLDQKHGISRNFTNALKNFDSKYKASEKAKAADEKYAVSTKATTAWNSLNSYFEQALGTPTGQKLRNFYVEGNKQVIDVHNEARHLANLKTGKPTGTEASSSCKCGSVAANCSCAPGTCNCANCAKNEATTSSVGVEEAEMHTVEGNRTKCNCGSTSEKCPCAPGTCACDSCAKNPDSVKA